jgi:predicted acetyltransferase
MALTPGATRGLWRFCCEMDLVSEVRATMRPIDDPIYWLLDDPRAAIRETRCTDYLWLLPLDVARLLGARRYSCENRLVLEVTDPRGLSGGRFALEGGPDGATCVPTSATAQLSMSMTALGTIALGGQPLHPLVEAGLIEEHSPGAAQRADLLFRWPLAPWCSTMF